MFNAKEKNRFGICYYDIIAITTLIHEAPIKTDK